ncbi:autotransporter outer membrane beta-barrel domain-containing protein [Ignatzschineria sp. F8392]|uniref:autotransporter outer membrane beta-barrel domain-containing protein n=1 Tax=Ignatzschineria sp. F8392 TaxID=1980117 RepID=UPI001302F00F|nr:autotransporter outer membrane beta-barrel domain-containing protein [Ignatzschineria sp. F8392]
MNRNIYKVVWNKALRIWVVASELAKNKFSRTTSVNTTSSSFTFKKTPIATLLTSLMVLGFPTFSLGIELKDILASGVTEMDIGSNTVTYTTKDQLVMDNQKLKLNFDVGKPYAYLTWKYEAGSSDNTVNLSLKNKSELVLNGEFQSLIGEGSGNFYTKVDDSILTVNNFMYLGRISSYNPDKKYNNYIVEMTNGGELNASAVVIDLYGAITLENSILNTKKTRRNTVYYTYDYRDEVKGTIHLRGNSAININDLEHVKELTNWDSYSDISNDNLHLKTTGINNKYNFLAGRLTAFTANPDFNAKFVLGSDVDVAVGSNGVKPYSAILRLYRNDAYGSVDITMHDSALIELMGDGSGGKENPVQSTLLNKLIGNGTVTVREDYLFNKAQDQFKGLLHIMEATDPVVVENASGKKVTFDFAHSAGTAKVAVNDALGTVGSTVINDHKLIFVDGKISHFVSNLEGKGATEVGENNIVASGDHDQFTGVLDLNNVDGSWNVSRSAGDYNINYALAGKGAMNIGVENNIYFNNTTEKQDFTGIFNVTKGNAVLNKKAGYALNQATLNINQGTQGTVEDDVTVGTLGLSDGKLVVTHDQNSEFNLITATEGITLTGNNKVEIANKDLLGKSSAINNIKPTGTLLDQQNQVVTGETFALGKTEGGRESLTLVDSAGNAITNVVKTSKPIVGQENKGTAFYDYSRLVADDAGIHAGYGLTALSAIKAQSVTIDSGNTTEQNLFVQLTGDGGFTYTGNQLITVTNSENDYLGDSILDNGSVALGANNALGLQGALLLIGKSNLDLASFAQSASFTTVAQDSILNLNSGTLNLTDHQASLIDGQLQGGKDSSLNLNQGALTVNSSNGALEANINLGSNVTAMIAKTDGLGKGNLNLAGSNKIAINGAGDFANRVQGDSSNQLNINATDGAVTLTADNSDYAGELNIAEKAQANVTVLNNIGTGILGVAGILQFNSGVNGDLNNAFKGAGTVTLTDNQLAIKGDHTGFTGTARIGEKATWSVTQAGDYDINYALSGNGTATVNAGGMIALKNAGDQSFTGTFDVTKGQLQLDQTGFDVLTNASLGLKGGQANVMLDGQKVKQLTFNNGSLYLAPFNNGERSNHLYVTDGVKLVGQDNLIKVDSAKSVEKHDIDWGSSFVGKPSFIDQQFGVIGETLVFGKVDKTAGTIFLADKDGNYIRAEDVEMSDRVLQSGNGKAYYGFNGLLSNDEGIHLNYGLAVLEAYQAKNIEVLSTTENVTGISNILRAKLTGDGGFIFKGDKAIVIDGFANDYKGDTNIIGADITAKSHNIFGQQGALTLTTEAGKGAKLDLDQYTQKVSKLDLNEGSVLNFNKGTLTLLDAKTSTIAGSLLGSQSSKLNINQGIANVNSSNSELQSSVNLGTKVTLNLAKADALGTSAITLNQGSNTINLNAGGEFKNQLTGDATNTLNINANDGKVAVDLVADNSGYAGAINIAKDATAKVNALNNLGTGLLGVAGKLAFNSEASGDLNNAFAGAGTIALDSNMLNVTGKHDGFTGLLDLVEGSTWSVTDQQGDYNINYALAGSGTMNVGAEQNILLNNKNENQSYTGNFNVHQGNLVLNTTAGYALKTGNVHLLAGTKGTVENDLIVGSLELDKSTLKVTATDGKFNLLTATNGIVLEGDTKVEIDNKDLLGNAEIDTDKGLLDQQNIANLGELFAKGKTSGDKKLITLIDADGNEITEVKDIHIQLKGQEIAGDGIYDYTGLVADDIGIHAGYGLKALSANKDHSIKIDSTGAEEQKLFVKLTGEGGFTYTGDKAITVTGENNDYLGDSTFAEGQVALGADNALGQQGALIFTGISSLDLSKFSQVADSVTQNEESTINLNSGHLTLTDQQDSTFEGALSGTDQSSLTVEKGALNVTSSNAELASKVHLGSHVIANLAKADALGKGKIHLAENSVINVNGSGNFANELMGDSSAALNIQGTDSDVTLLGDNSAYSGTLDIAENAKANVTNLNNLGEALLGIDGTLHFNEGVNGDLDNMLKGAGTVTLTDNKLNIKGNHAGFTGVANLGETAIWSVTQKDPYDINYALTGNGTAVMNAGGIIALKNAGEKSFTGNFDVTKGQLLLDQTGFDVLTNASLGLKGGQANLMLDGQKVENLTFNNGSLYLALFNNGDRLNHLSVSEKVTLIGQDNYIKVDSADSIVRKEFDEDALEKLESLSFIEQQYGISGETVVKGQVDKKNGAIFLADKDGNLIEAKDVPMSSQDLKDGSGTALFGFNGLRPDDDGIHFNYGLAVLNAFEDKNIEVNSTNENTTTSNILRAKLTGIGGFIFKGDKAIVIDGFDNDYQGDTQIMGANITAKSDNIFGHVGALTLGTNDGTAAKLDLDQYAQKVNKLDLNEGSTLNLNKGTLTLLDAKTSIIAGSLLGTQDSKLNINQGIVNVNSSNSELKSSVNLGTKVTLNLAKADGLGASTIALNKGGNIINLNGGGEFKNQLTGDTSNTLNINANSNKVAVDLGADNSSYEGAINIAEKATANVNALNNLGTGVIGVAGNLVFNSEASGDLANKFKGDGEILLKGNSLNVTGEHDGFTGLLNLADNATWSVTDQQGSYNINYALTGDGTINVASAENITLKNETENQNYTGHFKVHNGNLVLNTTAEKALKEAGLHLLEDTKGTVENALTVGSLTLDNSTLKVTDQDGKFNILTASGGIVLQGDTEIEIDNKDLLGKGQAVEGIQPEGTLLDQQNQLSLGETFAKGKTTGDRDSITLVDSEGNIVSGIFDVQKAIVGQEENGVAIYDYSKLVADDTGIHAGYGLAALSANVDKGVTIDSQNSTETTLSVKLTGEGGFTYTGNQAITITGQQNDYQGASTIKEGSVNLGADNALGEKGALVLTGGALNLAGFAQRADQLTADEKSKLDLAGGTLSLTNGANTIAGDITGDGSSTLNVEKGSLNVDSRNANLSATINLGSKVAATLANADGLGKGDIHLAEANKIDINGSGDFANNLTGEDANNRLNLNKGEINLLGNNSEYAGTINIGKEAQANVNRLRNLGTGVVNVDGILKFDNSTVSGDFKNVFAGAGTIQLNGNTLNVTGEHDGFDGLLNLAEGSTWSVTDRQGDYNINYGLTGNGMINVGTEDTIALKKDPADNFVGDFNVKQGDLALDNNGLSTLEKASLGLIGGSATLMEDGKSLKNLTFDQGVMTLNTVTGEERFNHLTVTDIISLRGDQNKIQVDPAIIPVHDKDLGNVDQKISFLDQQFGEKGETLISGQVIVQDNNGVVNPDFEAIFLADKDGKLIESKNVGQSTALIQNNAGKAYYGFNGLKTDEHGIHLNYGLDELEAFKDKNIVVLSDTSNVNTDARDLRVELVGKGGFIFKGSEAITLSGNENSYTGNTLIDGTSITAGMNHVFGQAGNLTISNKGAFDLSEKKQIVDTLAIEEGSTLDIRRGELTVRESSTLKGGTLLGAAGTFIFAGKSGDEELTIEGIHNVGVDTTLQNGRINITKDALYGNGDGKVTVMDRGVLGGYGALKGDLLLQGQLNVGSTMSRSVGEALGHFTVDGNFTAEKGSLILIASDGKEAGRLIITGNAEGDSSLQVNDMQGQDLIQLADGTKKVEVVTIGGDLNTLELTQKGRAVRGAFDYILKKEADGNWWLVTLNEGGENPGGGGNGGKPLYRPETAAYTGGLDVANRLFTHQLADRNYLDPSSRLWTIMGGDFGKFYDDGKHNRTTIDSFRMMLGGDIVQTQIEEMPVKVGLFAAYGHSSIKSRQAATGLSAKGRSHGFGLGLYATLGDKVTEGLYLDGSIQYVHFRNKISGDELVEETMKTKGLITSLEGGYTWQLAESLYLQPQAQITWMGAKMDSLTDHYGTHISGSKNNIETRLGARLFMEKTLESGHLVTPYLELNYYHNSKPFYTYFDETKIEQKGTRNVGEMKLGFEGKVEKDLNIWGEVGYRKGSNSYHNTTISVGLRYDF